MNGYGERCGNANLVSIVPNLQLKMGRECLPDLTGLTEASHFLDELLNFVPDPNRPYVGANAFAHKGGMHVAGVDADPATFEHIDPAAVGNAREVLISELSGKGTVLQRAEATGVELDAGDRGARRRARQAARARGLPLRGRRRLLRPADPARDGRVPAAVPARVLARDRREARGRQACRPRPRSRSGSTASATCAPRRATARCTRSTPRCARRSRETYPHLADIRLVNYKVRILDEQKATGAVTRVLLDASDGTDTWGAIGVSENVIEASWDALVDSLEAGMLPGRVHHRARRRGAPAPAP